MEVEEEATAAAAAAWLSPELATAAPRRRRRPPPPGGGAPSRHPSRPSGRSGPGGGPLLSQCRRPRSPHQR